AFLIPLFFVWTGLNVNLAIIPKQLGLIGLLIAIAILGTLAGTIAAIWLMTRKIKEGFLVGWGLSSKGDIELVLAAVALKTGVITQNLFTALVIMSLATMIISPLFLKYSVGKKKQEKK
ncbi:cation:proton antiporter, partial [Candidatus Woesearchaeota archaeon]|nr:cation:proton antiporter [Candidatus Woesearchaeota archaeon]